MFFLIKIEITEKISEGLNRTSFLNLERLQTHIFQKVRKLNLLKLA